MAGIGLDFVGIVTGFKTFFTLFQVEPDDAVTARGENTCIAAAIVLAVVAIVASFRTLHATVAAEFQTTKRIAAVTVDDIRIIALFGRFLVGPDHAVPATRYLAVIGAGIAISAVPVIAGLIAVPDIAITTAGRLAAAGAVVGFNVVAIVAAFTAGFTYAAIATAHGLALIRAAIAGVLVAIITLFAVLLDSIATAGRAAVVEAGIHRILVAIVAGLIVFAADFEIGTGHPIATRRCSAVVSACVEVVVVSIVTAFPLIDDGVAAEIGALGAVWCDGIAPATGGE